MNRKIGLNSLVSMICLSLLLAFAGKIQAVPTVMTGTKQLYGSGGQLDYTHLPSNEFIKYKYDRNGNLLGKEPANMEPDSSVDLNGTDVYEIPNLNVDTSFGSKTTVEFWMFWDGKEVVMPFAWSSKFDLYFADGYFGFNHFNGDIFGIPSTTLKNKWVHVAAVFYNGDPDSGNLELYINGVKQTLQKALGKETWGESG